MPGALVDAGDKPAWVSKFQLPLTAEAAKDLVRETPAFALQPMQLMVVKCVQAEYVKKAPDAELSKLGLLAAPRPRQTLHLENADVHVRLQAAQVPVQELAALQPHSSHKAAPSAPHNLCYQPRHGPFWVPQPYKQAYVSSLQRSLSSG